MMLSVGIVTYESQPELLDKTVGSLLNAISIAHQAYGLTARIVFVLNDRKAHHIQQVEALVAQSKQQAPDYVEIVTLGGHGNIGYGAGQNKGIQCGESDYYLVLNPDVSFDSNILLKSIRYLESHPGDVMVVPQGYDQAERYAYLSKRAPTIPVLLARAFSSSWLNRVFRTQVARYTYKDMLPSLEPRSITLASGCFMFCRTAALRKVNGFDEGYFLYFEDFDLSFRLKRIGNIVELPDIRICHYGGETAHRDAWRKFHFLKSAIRFFSRYGWRRPSHQRSAFVAPELSSEISVLDKTA